MHMEEGNKGIIKRVPYVKKDSMMTKGEMIFKEKVACWRSKHRYFSTLSFVYKNVLNQKKNVNINLIFL